MPGNALEVSHRDDGGNVASWPMLILTGLEHVGGIMAYGVSDPTAPQFVPYESAAPGDLSPEGLALVPAQTSPVFSVGVADVAVTITVTDSLEGKRRTYSNPESTAFTPIQDTAGFATCP